MYENRVHFKFQFVPIYLFSSYSSYTLMIMLVEKKTPSAKKKYLCLAGGLLQNNTVYFSLACWFTVIESSNWPWKCKTICTSYIFTAFLLKAVEIKMINQVLWTIKRISKGLKVSNVPIYTSSSCGHAQPLMWTYMLSHWCPLMCLHCELLKQSTSRILPVRIQLH